jgi:hypothetical protein
LLGQGVPAAGQRQQQETSQQLSGAGNGAKEVLDFGGAATEGLPMGPYVCVHVIACFL